MKYLGLILVLALVAGQVLAFRINENDSPLIQSRPRRSFNDKLRKFLEHFKDIVSEGSDTLGIPPMDPFVSKELNITLDTERVNGTAHLTDFLIVGLSGYNVDKAEIGILSRKLTIGLTWPQIYTEGSYKLDVNLSDGLRVFGEGRFTATANDVSFESVVKIGISGGVKIKQINTTIRLGSLTFEATGLFNDDDSSEMVSATITDMAPQLVEDYQPELTDIVNKKVTKIVNEKLKGKSISDIIRMLG